MEVQVSAHKDIGEMLSSQHSKEKTANRAYLSKAFENILFLGQQGLPMRGRWIPRDGDERGECEKQLSFYPLLLLRRINPGILECLKQKSHKYTDHQIQNEVLKYVAVNHLVWKAIRIFRCEKLPLAGFRGDVLECWNHQ